MPDLHPTDPRRLVWGTAPDGRPLASAATPVCDFCLTPGPAWEYPATSMPIEHHHTITRSEDEWGACDLCSELIEAKALGRLVERCIAEQRRQLTGSDAVFPPLAIQRRRFRETLLRFFDARTGPRRPWQP